MTKALLFVSIGLALVVSNVFAGSSPNMKEGKWEITSKMEMIGMPMKMPAATFTQCLTRKEMVPQDTQQGQECKINKIRTKGNTVSWRMTCQSQGGALVGNGTIRYAGDRFSGTMEMTQQGMKMINRMKGKYVGACE